MAATSKMIDYAKGISRELNIPFKETDDFNYVATFISTNQSAYKKHFNNIHKQNEKNGIKEKFKKSQIITDILYYRNKGKSGVYIFWSKNRLMYIGKSKNLPERVVSSLKERNNKKNPITSVSFVFANEADASILEALLIVENNPKLNIQIKSKEKSELFQSGIDIKKLERYEVINIE